MAVVCCGGEGGGTREKENRSAHVFCRNLRTIKATNASSYKHTVQADVYQAQFREKKPGKAGEIHALQTRDFLGEGVAGNGFCKFLLLITTSQTKSEETFPSY